MKGQEHNYLSFPIYVFSWLQLKISCKRICKATFEHLLAAVIFYKAKSPCCSFFGTLIGLFKLLDENSFDVFVELMKYCYTKMDKQDPFKVLNENNTDLTENLWLPSPAVNTWLELPYFKELVNNDATVCNRLKKKIKEGTFKAHGHRYATQVNLWVTVRDILEECQRANAKKVS